MTVISYDGVVLPTMPCPVPPRERHRLRGARRAASITLPPRRSGQGAAAGIPARPDHGRCQENPGGIIHAVTMDAHNFRLDIDGELVAIVPRTTTREIRRYKACRQQGARQRIR